VNEIDPWPRGPLELIRHADGHLRDAGDTDRLIALIGFDNAIEVCIDVFINLHPRLRGSVEITRQERDKALRNYHTKVEFLDRHVQAQDISIKLPIEHIVWYHQLRNELYHSGNGMIPELHVIQGCRDAALTVFRVLFGVDVARQLGMANAPKDMSAVRLPRSSSNDAMELLRIYVDFEQALRQASERRGLQLKDRETAVRLWSQYRATVPLESRWDEVVRRASQFRNAYAHGQPVEASSREIEDAFLDLMQLTEELQTPAITEAKNG